MLIKRMALLGQQHFSGGSPLIHARYFSPELVVNWPEAIKKFPEREIEEPTLTQEKTLPIAMQNKNLVPIKKLIINSCRASGPSGQHINKNTNVSVSFHLKTADWLPRETRQKLGEIHKANLSKDGYLTIRSGKTRSQTLNIADCMDKLRAYISEAEQPPEPKLSLETIELKRQRLERAAAERLKITQHCHKVSGSKKAEMHSPLVQEPSTK